MKVLHSLWVVALLVLMGCSGLNPRYPAAPQAFAEDRVDFSWSHFLVDGWQPGDGAVRLRPAHDEARLYAAHIDGTVVALNNADGRVQWKKTLNPWQVGITLHRDQLFLLSQTGDLVVLDANTGAELQRTEWGISAVSPMVVQGNQIAILGQDGALRLWDNTSRSWVWIYDSEQPVLTLHGQAQPLFYRDALIAGFANGRVVAFDLLSGEIRWSHRLAQPRGVTDLQRLVDVDVSPLLVNGRIYVAAYEGQLMEIIPETGEVRWRTELSVSTNLATDDALLFVANRTGELFAYDVNSKAILWQQQAVAGRPLTALTVQGDHLVVTDRRGYVYAFQRSNGQPVGRLDFSGRQRFTVPAIADAQNFYVQSMQGLLLKGHVSAPQE
ncbi:PQQ-binding-like beta-propeller repeat protein [Salinispirillum marinum]|uniref:Outer membrane protein assembly factor BamB n=2 Tax=Saccharospirillaceae TaxID=255527 RepID=A0ABV8BJ25_9GAMM